MTSHNRLRTRLHKGISILALVAAFPQAVGAQNIVVNQNEPAGLSFGDIDSFDNPGFNVTNFGGVAGVDTDNVFGDFTNSGKIDAKYK